MSSKNEKIVVIAFETHTSIEPNASSTVVAASCTWSKSATSVGSTSAVPPAASTSRAAASSPSRPRASSATRAPSRANRSTIARPTPLVAPVTTTTSLIGVLLARPVDRRSGVDERQVRQPLREVAEERARLRVDLLGVEPDVVPQRDQRVHRLARLVEAAEPRERLHEPERAGDERAFAAAPARVAVEQRPARAEPLAHRVDRRVQPLH